MDREEEDSGENVILLSTESEGRTKGMSTTVETIKQKSPSSLAERRRNRGMLTVVKRWGERREGFRTSFCRRRRQDDGE